MLLRHVLPSVCMDRCRRLGVNFLAPAFVMGAGFGWTNGVMLSLLDRYGWDPSAYTPPANATATSAPTLG